MRRVRISRGRRRVVATALAIAVLWAVAPAGARATTVEEVRADVRYLSAPELDGRGALTAGLDQAARFIAVRFAAAGLLPAGDGGTFFQQVAIPLPQRPSPEARLAIARDVLAPGVDFLPNAGSASC